MRPFVSLGITFTFNIRANFEEFWWMWDERFASLGALFAQCFTFLRTSVDGFFSQNQHKLFDLKQNCEKSRQIGKYLI